MAQLTPIDLGGIGRALPEPGQEAMNSYSTGKHIPSLKPDSGEEAEAA